MSLCCLCAGAAGHNSACIACCLLALLMFTVSTSTSSNHCITLPAYQKLGSALLPAQCLFAALTALPAAVASSDECAPQQLAAAASAASRERKKEVRLGSGSQQTAVQMLSNHSRCSMFALQPAGSCTDACRCVWQWAWRGHAAYCQPTCVCVSCSSCLKRPCSPLCSAASWLLL